MNVKKLLFSAGVTSFAPSLGLLFLRVAIGGMMIAGHGWAKLTGFGDMASSFPDPLGIGSELSLAAAVGADIHGDGRHRFAVGEAREAGRQ